MSCNVFLSQYHTSDQCIIVVIVLSWTTGPSAPMGSHHLLTHWIRVSGYGSESGRPPGGCKRCHMQPPTVPHIHPEDLDLTLHRHAIQTKEVDQSKPGRAEASSHGGEMDNVNPTRTRLFELEKTWGGVFLTRAYHFPQKR